MASLSPNMPEEQPLASSSIEIGSPLSSRRTQYALNSELEIPPVMTIDGEILSAVHARTVARRYFRAGFFLLPLSWVVVMWLFWPQMIGRRNTIIDPVVQKCTY